MTTDEAEAASGARGADPTCVVDPSIAVTPAAAPAPGLSTETIARLGHELRTPIAAILSLADVMAKGHFGPLGSARYEDYARSIRETARHALGVIAAMLDPDAIGRPIAEQTFTEVDLNDVVADAARSVEPLARDSGLTLDFVLTSRLPRLIVDRLAVQQIVLNLLANGIAHAGAGARMQLRTGGTIGGETWFEAEDDGPGVPASVIQSVTMGTAAAGLDAFSSTTEGGLGLRLIRALAEANGGRLEITDVCPHGARVRIAFNASRAVPV